MGRFHVLDLARELSGLGYDVSFLSYVPRKRAVAFGLPARCHVGLFTWLSPFLALRHFFRRWSALPTEAWLYRVANWVVCRKMPPCDLFIGMSGVYLEAALYAKERFKAKVIIERGSLHILSQVEILSAAPAAAKPSTTAISRELAGYALADRISVPAEHVAKSFVEHGILRSRLFVNPYGVNVRHFEPSPHDAREFDLIFVGTWSYQKGADLLVEALALRPQWTLLHVGSVGELDLPHAPNITSVGFVDQQSLPNAYARARVLVLPSRQEGLSLVQAQALACGLPIVCSERTGGSDLSHLIEHSEAVTVVDPNDVGKLVAGIEHGLQISRRLLGTDLIGEQGRRQLSWESYGARYKELVDELLSM